MSTCISINLTLMTPAFADLSEQQVEQKHGRRDLTTPTTDCGNLRPNTHGGVDKECRAHTVLNELQLGGELGQEEIHLSDHIPPWRALARSSWKANMRGLQHIYASSPEWIHLSGSDLLDKLGIPPGSPLGPGSPVSPFTPEI